MKTIHMLAVFTLLYTNAAASEPEPAPGVPATQRKMIVGTYVNQVFGVDIKGSSFQVDFYIWFRWPSGPGVDDWKPLDTFEVTNGRISSRTGIVKKKLGNENYASCRVHATITKFWDLKRFPLDHHTLHLDIEDIELDDRQMVFVSDHDNAGINPDLQIPGWVVKGGDAEVSRNVYHTNYGDTSLPTNRESAFSRYQYAIKVIRPGYGRFLKVFFGLFVSVLISFCAFFVRPKESSPRVSLGVGATFAAAAVTVAINNSLPDTNAVTLADKLVMLTLGTIVASVAATIAALTLFAHGKEGPQKKLDRWCAFLFPAFYTAMLLWIVW